MPAVFNPLLILQNLFTRRPRHEPGARERYEAARDTILLHGPVTDEHRVLFVEGDALDCDLFRLLEIVLIIEPDAEYAERLYYMTAP